MTAPELPNLAIFDPRATRIAVLRGLLRTAGLVILLYLAFALAGNLVGGLLFQIGDRPERMDRARAALLVAHPGIPHGSSGRTGSRGWLHTTDEFFWESPEGNRVEAGLRINALGQLSVNEPPEDKLTRAVRAGRASKEQSTAFVEGLPDAAVSDVVVEFAKPLSEHAFPELLDSDDPLQFALSTTFYVNPFEVARETNPHFQTGIIGNADFGSSPMRRPVTWQIFRRDDFRGSFAEWTRVLDESDNSYLRVLGLPDADVLRKLGRRSLVHAIYVTDVPVDQLRRLVAKPLVRGVTPVDVRLTILNRNRI